MSTANVSINAVVVAMPGQVFANLDNETVILELTSGMYYGLNQTGTIIWHLLQEPIQVQAICEALMEEFEVDFDECMEAVVSLVQQLAEHNLVDIQYASTEKLTTSFQLRPDPIR